MKTTSYISSRIFSLSKNHLSSTVMRLAVTSVVLGVAVMVISIAVVIGFKNEIRNKVVGFIAPIHVVALNQNASMEESPFVYDSTVRQCVESCPGVKSSFATASKVGLLKTDDEIHGIVMRGVENDYDWTYMQRHLVEGTVPSFSDSISSEILISSAIARKMSLKIGDAARIWFVDEAMRIRGRRLNVVGVYETGLAECDERFAFCHLAQIRRLNGWTEEQVGNVEVHLQEGYDAAEVNNLLYYKVPPQLRSITAEHSYPQIFDWLQLLDMNVLIIIALLLVVAGITVISMMLIIILEKTSTIGLLKALGADNRFIRKVFLRRSLHLLLLGMLIGNAVGLLLCWLQQSFHLISLDQTTYYLSSVPIEINLFYVVLLNVGIFLVWTLMLLVPTMIINNINPCKSIRFE